LLHSNANPLLYPDSAQSNQQQITLARPIHEAGVIPVTMGGDGVSQVVSRRLAREPELATG
jgi:hypothetical protein